MKNIEINYLDVSGYEVLYPKTTTENLIDFGEVLYTKEEVDGFIAGLSNQMGNLHFAYGTYTGQFSSSTVNLGGGAKATEWQTIIIGFEPVGVILSIIGQGDSENSVFPVIISASRRRNTGGSSNSSSIGFALPVSENNYTVIEAIESGFRVRSVASGSEISLNYNPVYLNNKYAYLAFG